MNAYDLNDRKFYISLMKKNSEIPGNSGKLFNKLRHKINEQKKYFPKETETKEKEPNRNSGTKEFSRADQE